MTWAQMTVNNYVYFSFSFSSWHNEKPALFNDDVVYSVWLYLDREFGYVSTYDVHYCAYVCGRPFFKHIPKD